MAQIVFRHVRQTVLFFVSCMFIVCAARTEAAPLLLEGGKNSDSRALRLVLDSLSRGQATIIDLQRELVSRPAVNPEFGGTGEEAKARWIETWLNERGIRCERLDQPDERVPAKLRPNLVALYPGPANGPTLWLLSHLDTAAVVLREEWNGDPFVLRVQGDVLYGRGVEDNNQAIASSLLLLASLRETGAAPPCRLGLLMTSSALADYAGIQHVIAVKPDLFGPGDLIVVMDYGNTSGSLISVSEKGCIWLEIDITGKSGHAGRPDRANNAFAAAAELVCCLPQLDRQFPKENLLFQPPRSTFAPTSTRDFNTGINHVPGKFVFHIDARVTDAYSFAEVENGVRALADEVEKKHGVRIGMKRIDATPSTRVTPTNSPVVAALGRAIRDQLGVEPGHVGTGSVTVAATLREKGLPVAVWGVQETMHNRPNEHALISAHIKQAQVLARMLFETPAANIASRRGGGEGER